MKNIKTTQAEKAWFAHRCGELLVKAFRENIGEIVSETLDRHALEDTPDNRQAIHKAYRTANPNNKQYACDTYDPHYERGAENNMTEHDRIVGYTEIDRQRSLKAVRDHFIDRLKSGEISVMGSDIVNLLKIESTPTHRTTHRHPQKEHSGDSETEPPADTNEKDFVDILEKTAAGRKETDAIRETQQRRETTEEQPDG